MGDVRVARLLVVQPQVVATVDGGTFVDVGTAGPTVSTGAAGLDGAHANMQPYQVLNYFIKY